MNEAENEPDSRKHKQAACEERMFIQKIEE